MGIEDNVCPGKHAGHGAVSPRRFGLIMELCVFDPRHISFGVEFNAGDPETVTGFIYMRSSRRVDPFAVKPARSNLAANAIEKQPA